MLDFPDSPTTGQVYLNWTFDGTKWVPLTATALPFSPGRNLVTNGAFNIWQRGSGAFNQAGGTRVFTTDRWYINQTNDTISCTRGTMTDASRATIGDEAAAYYAGLSFTGSSTAGSGCWFSHRIEGARRITGKTITVSFWATASAVGLKVGVGLYVAVGSGGSPSGGGSLSGQAVTLSTTWARYSVTFNVPTSAGMVFGTNGDDNVELDLYLSDQAAGAYSGRIGQQSGAVWFYGVQLEIGSGMSPFDAGGTPQQQLAECQRHFETLNITQDFFSPPPASPINYMMRSYRFAVSKRANPTITFAGMTYYNGGNVVAFPATPTVFGVSQDMVGFGYNGLSDARGFSGGNVSAAADL